MRECGGVCVHDPEGGVAGLAGVGRGALQQRNLHSFVNVSEREIDSVSSNIKYGHEQ